MYSKNDYRYYLERRMANDNYLAHARAHKYIKKIGKRYFYTQQEIDAFMNKDKKSDEVKEVFDLMGQNSRKMLSDPKNAAKDIRNVINGTRKRSLELAREDNVRGVKKTENTMKEIRNRSSNKFSERKTKTAPNMYTTNNKGKYTNDKYNHSSVLNSGGLRPTVTKTYGQKQKKADIKADKKMRRDYINQQNPYSYDKNKSLKKNVASNKNVAKKRKTLKQRAYNRVDEEYRNV